MNPLIAAPQIWWWISFVDPSMVGRKGWLGVTAILAPSVEVAVTIANLRGISPGGEAAGADVPADWGAPPAELDHKLVTNQRRLAVLAREWFGDAGRLMTPREFERETGKPFMAKRVDQDLKRGR